MHKEATWASKRIQGRTRRQVEAMFQAEKLHLWPLPLTGFSYLTGVVRTVRDDNEPPVGHGRSAQTRTKRTELGKFEPQSYCTTQVAPLRRSSTGAFSPILRWHLCAGHRLALKSNQ
ncbi:hypothetical protein EOS_37970 [Caballeronia mineralivorans PML1(12)]|uniref:Uncharacterized protein n=1 Tax=Caballeronia mineralivorans PML1(12) TaxID=908627 RepID=A0A0J1CKK6_9BURK|nr:hypothetical protein EOS_37970 [Caballeronia mineralivorans PML1(12)]